MTSGVECLVLVSARAGDSPALAATAGSTPPKQARTRLARLEKGEGDLKRRRLKAVRIR
jgi:hypothetical protein